MYQKNEGQDLKEKLKNPKQNSKVDLSNSVDAVFFDEKNSKKEDNSTKSFKNSLYGETLTKDKDIIMAKNENKPNSLTNVLSVQNKINDNSTTKSLNDKSNGKNTVIDRNLKSNGKDIEKSKSNGKVVKEPLFVQGKDDDKDIKERNVELYSKNGESKKIKKRSYWAIKITVVTFVLTIFFSFLSELTSSSGNIIVAILLLTFLILGNIVFDGIGVAVTACNLSPLVSMSSRRIYGAKTAVNLVKNAEKVSNICSDVIGDIFGIVSGACSVAIVIKLMTLFQNPNQQILTIGLSSIVAAITVGGKALIKEIAIKNSKELVLFVSRIIAVFSKEERKCRKKKVITQKNGDNNNNGNNHN